jgi:hypothetical protein
VVGQLDVASAAVMRRRARAAALVLAAVSMAHVGSPDTFFGGKAGPYGVRISVRLPGVIPGRAQVMVRIEGVNTRNTHHVTVRAGQWNVGLKGAPPAEVAMPVPGDPALYMADLWFMTATSYQLAVDVDGPVGRGAVVIPVLALATAERPMPPWLGAVLAGLGVFLTVGLLTIIGAAVRESGLPPGAEPDAVRRRRARIGVAVTGLLTALALWGGNRWWAVEASIYRQSVLYRPFSAVASVARQGERRIVTLSIRDQRWNGMPVPQSRYNALIPDHGKLMHLFLVRVGEPEALAHLHPIARTAAGLDFDADVPPLLPGRYRVYGDIVHESGYAQTMVSSVDLDGEVRASVAPTDVDDSSFTGAALPEAPTVWYDLGDGSRLVWDRGDEPIAAGAERDLRFRVQNAAGAGLNVEPYMGMAAHVVIVSRDGSVFAHLHPSGSISMAAMQRLTSPVGADPHAGHAMPLEGRVDIPYAFPKAGAYRLFVQVKRGGTVRTSAFDVNARAGRP